MRAAVVLRGLPQHRRWQLGGQRADDVGSPLVEFDSLTKVPEGLLQRVDRLWRDLEVRQTAPAVEAPEAAQGVLAELERLTAGLGAERVGELLQVVVLGVQPQRPNCSRGIRARRTGSLTSAIPENRKGGFLHQRNYDAGNARSSRSRITSAIF